MPFYLNASTFHFFFQYYWEYYTVAQNILSCVCIYAIKFHILPRVSLNCWFSCLDVRCADSPSLRDCMQFWRPNIASCLLGEHSTNWTTLSVPPKVLNSGVEVCPVIFSISEESLKIILPSCYNCSIHSFPQEII